MARDPNNIAIGDVLAETESAREGHEVRSLLMAALRYETGEALAYFPMPIAGRLAKGRVSTGSIYALDPFDNHSIVVEIDTATLSAKLQQSLALQGASIGGAKRLRLAAPSYVLENPQGFAKIDNVVSVGKSIRESLVELIRRDQGVLGV